MLTLTTDFGDSHYLGAMRGAILAVHPEARLVDLTHAVPSHDVRAGAFALLAAAPYFPRGTVHVAVVDPGVGGPRKGLLMETEGGLLVGPDNGLLVPAAKAMGLLQVRELANRALWREKVSSTFHGRDVFGPVAAHLDRGSAKPDDVGPVLQHWGDLDFGEAREEGGALVGEVILVDGFGNCITNVPGALARRALREGAEVRVEWAGGASPARFVPTYASARPGEAVAVVGSAGYLEVALVQGSFAAVSGLGPGRQVRVAPA